MGKLFVLVLLLVAIISSPAFYLAYKADQRATKAEHERRIYLAEQAVYNTPDY